MILVFVVVIHTNLGKKAMKKNHTEKKHKKKMQKGITKSKQVIGHSLCHFHCCWL